LVSLFLIFLKKSNWQTNKTNASGLPMSSIS
jgi:hypothetical protein